MNTPANELCAERFLSAFQRGSGRSVKPQAPTSTPDQTKQNLSVSTTPASAAPTDWQTQLTNAKAALCETAPNTRFESLVALVPDPIESGLAFQFFATMHGLQVGMEAEVGTSLLRDESWLAWDDRRLEPPQRKRAEDCRFNTPGVLMFRSAKAPQEGRPTLALAFVVGETPLAGPHRAALEHALAAARRFNGSCNAVDEELPLRVLGPAFSAGAVRLRGALDGSGANKLLVRSGTASAPGVADVFRDSRADFARTTPQEPELMCALLDYVEAAGSPLLSRQDFMDRVALLTESSTVFGAANASAGDSPCAFRPGLKIQFPLGIAAVRNEYEQLARDDQRSPHQPIARRTSLELSMEDEQVALNFESVPPARIIDARDLSLGRALSAISSLSIQYVAIQATDIADAMFLARKVRDVVPDVRIAFFEANALLTHPDHRGDLLGSLVLSAYPLLGSNDFSDADTLHRNVFESESVLGVANAVMALRGRGADSLLDFDLLPTRGSLPIWVSAIGRDGLVPLRAHARELGTVVGDPPGKPAPASSQTGKALATRFDPPRLWQILFLCFVILTLGDWIRQAREQMRFEMSNGCGGTSLLRSSHIPSTDHDWDLAALRVKALGQQVTRSWICFALLAYMCGLSLLARELIMRDALGSVKLLCAGMVTVLAAALAIARTLQLASEAVAFHRYRATGTSHSAPDPVVKRVVRSLRYGMLFGCVCFLAIAGSALLHLLVHDPDWSAYLEHPSWFFESIAHASVGSTRDDNQALLFVLRSMGLGSGVSPFVPLALCALCTYVYALGRCARLHTAYELSSISPDDGVADGVSTPLTALLYPYDPKRSHGPREDRREGVRADEVHLVNAVAHPSAHNQRWLLAMLTVTVPVAFTLSLKRPSGLGSRFETLLLFISLIGGCALTLLVLLYLFEYWRGLERLLKRVLEHPIGFSFKRVHNFARDALPDMVARDPDETLRLAACAQIGSTLLATIPDGLRTPTCAYHASDSAALETQRSRALRRPSDAWSGLWGIRELTKGDGKRLASLLQGPWRLATRRESEDEEPPPHAPAAVGRDSAASLLTSGQFPMYRGVPEHNPRTVASLGYKVSSLACAAMALLERAWSPGLRDVPQQPAQARAKPTASHGAWATTHRLYTDEELRWLRDLERFVATVIALVIGRYVRQYKHFVYVSTSCALLLLCAVSSYAFEPQRVLMTCIWLLMAGTVSFTVLVYVGLDRNTLLSHISGSRPDRVTLSGAVLLRAGLWVLLPLVSVLAAQYPSLANGAYAMFEPIVRALR